jgi:hypothetical protein
MDHKYSSTRASGAPAPTVLSSPAPVASPTLSDTVDAGVRNVLKATFSSFFRLAEERIAQVRIWCPLHCALPVCAAHARDRNEVS